MLKMCHTKTKNGYDEKTEGSQTISKLILKKIE